MNDLKDTGINVLSLFDGLSGGRIALNNAGIKVKNYFASEVEKEPMIVSKYNYPDIKHIGDVTKVLGKDLPEIDLLIGGSPCQGFSFAGKQLNFEDPRSALFFEFVRLMKETKPKYFFLENVNMKKEYQDVITKLLKVNPIKINSSLMSPQLRNRLYWTNIPITMELDKNLNDIQLKDIVEDGYVDRSKAYCIDANYQKGGNLKSYFLSSRRQLVFKDEESYKQAKINLTNENYKIKGLARMLSINEIERAQCLPEGYVGNVNEISKGSKYKMIGNGWTISVIEFFFKNLFKDLSNN